MIVSQYAAPTIEPITREELESHLRLDADTLAESLTAYTCTASGSHPVTTGYTLYGTAVEVIGKKSLVYLRPVNNGTGATVDCKIQDSDDNTTWIDWTGGAFTQVTEANDTVIQEKEYTGVKRYIRTASKTLVLACEFGTDVIVKEATSTESDLLTAIIQAAREYVEDFTRRQLLTATWDYYQNDWPSEDYIKLPFGNLQNGVGTAPVVSWKDTDGTETTLTVTTDYLVETNGEGCGRIVLPYGCSWPSGSLYPSNPIKVRFTCGWTAAASIPSKIRSAILLMCADLYSNREGQIFGTNGQGYQENKTVARLLASSRLFDEFI